MTLHELKKGQLARIKAIHGDGRLRRSLLNLHITHGMVVQFLRNAPLGDPLQFQIADNVVAVRQGVAKQIEVELLETKDLEQGEQKWHL